MSYVVYILRMNDGRYYAGMTNDLARRSSEHGKKISTRTTKIFGFDEILYSEQHPDATSARKREQQIKRWTREKKEALINGNIDQLRELAKSRNKSND